MPSNKQRDLAKASKVETTGKNEIIYDSISLVPTMEKDKVIYNIMLIRFTIDGKLVSIETLDKATNEGSALAKLQVQTSLVCMDLKNIRNIARELRKLKEEEKDEEKTEL